MNQTKHCYSRIYLMPVFLLLLITILHGCVSHKQKEIKPAISQWRGEDRSGNYNETGLLTEWSAGGPELLWVREGIGKGYGSVSVLNDKIYVNGERDSVSYLFAFDTKGNVLWEAPNGREFMGEGFSATYPGARSTPTVVNDLVYTSSGKGRIACFETETGKEKWAVDIVNDLGGLDSYFGYSESVVIDENKLYCFPGGATNNTVALDRFTGDIIWSADAMQDTFSYCSPLLVEHAGKKMLITHSRHFLYTLNAVNGNLLGFYPIKHYEYDGEHCNSPLYDKGNVYFVGNEKEDGAGKFKLSEEGELQVLWKNNKIKNNFNAYVKVDEHLFTMVKGNWLKAIDTETGMVTDSVKAATGSIIYADKQFICYGMNGDVNLILNTDSGLEVKSTFKVKPGTGHHFAHPVVNNGILYIRHGNALMAYKIS